MIRRSKQKEKFLALVLLFFFSILYAYTAVPGVYGWDVGEIAAAVNGLGLAHPTGFPLLMLSGKLFSLLVPIGEVAFRLSLYSALLTAVSIVFLFFTFRNLGISLTISTITSFIFGFGQTIWNHAGTANVYSLSLLLVTILFFILSKWQLEKSLKFLYWYAFVLGISFGTHALMISMSVPLLVMLWQSKHFLRQNPGKLFNVFALFLIPFLQYIYLPFAYLKNEIVNWGEINNFQNFLNYITQKDFAQKVSARAGDGITVFFGEIAKLFTSEFTLPIFLIAVVGLLFLFKKNKYLGLSITFIVVVNIMVMFFYGNNQDIIGLFRYFFAAYTALAVAIAYGLDTTMKRIKRSHNEGWFILLVPLLILVIVLQFKTSYTLNNRRNTHVISDFANNMLDTVAPNSILITHGDPITGPAWYLQSIGQREDVVIVSANLIRYDWYVRNEAKRRPNIISLELLKTERVGDRLAQLIRNNLSNRKIYSIVSDIKAEGELMSTNFDFIPIGVVNQIVEKGTVNIKEVLDLNKTVWSNYKLRGVKSNFYDDIMVDNMTKYYALTLNNIGMAYFRNGLTEDALGLLQKSVDINPDPRVQENLERVKKSVLP